MPRGNALTAEYATLKMLLMAHERVGKSDWAMRAAEAGFNVLYIDGDGAGRTISQLAKDAAHRLFYFNVADRIEDGTYDHRMIDFVADFFSVGKILWNDTTQAPFNRIKDNLEESEVWEIRPSKFDHNWVIVIDSWTTLSQSALQAKALDLGVELSDVEKVERKIYSGVGNRLTQIAQVLKGMRCHVVVTGHPAEYAKKRAPDGVTLRNIKEDDMITEWTRTIPKSSSNPHGLTLGKNFTEIGWIDITRTGKRELNFEISNSRVSGGILSGKGDPRGDFTFGKVVTMAGGSLPVGEPDIAPALVIHEKGQFVPAATGASKVLNKAAASTSAGSTAAPQPEVPTVALPRGLAALAALKKGGPTAAK